MSKGNCPKAFGPKAEHRAGIRLRQRGRRRFLIAPESKRVLEPAARRSGSPSRLVPKVSKAAGMSLHPGGLRAIMGGTVKAVSNAGKGRYRL